MPEQTAYRPNDNVAAIILNSEGRIFATQRGYGSAKINLTA